MKNQLKKFVGVFLCAAMLASNVVLATEKVADADAGTADKSTVTEVQTVSKAVRYDPEKEFTSYAGYIPDYSKYSSEQYALFLDILNLYSDTHLYEFTSDQAMEAFVMRLFQQNPDLVKLFIDTLLGTMDEYSAYYESGMGPASDGSSLAYGLVYSKRDDGVYISDMIENSPAEKAGLMIGDKVIAVEGIPTEGLTLDATGYLMKYLPYVADEEFDENGVSLGIPNEPEFIINELTGKKEYPLHIDVMRNGEILSVKMVRERIITSDISYSKAENNKYSYISIDSFTKDSCGEDFKAALDLAKKANNGNLIIDVRENGGGLADNAIFMANLLIPEKGRLLYYINSRKYDQPEPVYSEGNDYGYTFDKIIVLVNENTASAAEMFANILRYHCGATIVGMTTYGKAVGQQSYVFTNGDMFTITTFEFLDHLKRSYNRIGIIPDIEIDLTLRKEEYTAPEKELLVENIADFVLGTQSDAVAALQERLVICGFLLPEYASGVYDSVTDAAVKAFLAYYYGNDKEPMSEKTVNLLNSVTEKRANRYYYYDSQLDVAEFALSSRSQGKRRAKELMKEHEGVQKQYDEWQAAEAEKIKNEIKAEQEAAEKEAAEAEAEAVQPDENAEAAAPEGENN